MNMENRNFQPKHYNYYDYATKDDLRNATDLTNKNNQLTEAQISQKITEIKSELNHRIDQIETQMSKIQLSNERWTIGTGIAIIAVLIALKLL